MGTWFKDTLQSAGTVRAGPAAARTGPEPSSREVPEGSPDDHHLVFPLLARALLDGRPRSVAVLGPRSEAMASCLARLLGGCRVVGLGPGPEGAGRDGGRDAGPYDAAVCFESMPTHQMPIVPSESTETYRRGPNWGPWRRAEDGAVRQVASRLGAARRLVREGGTVLLRELLPDVSSALCLARLACEAGLRCTGWAHAHLHASADRPPDGRDGPVLLAEVSPGPVAFREEEALGGILPPLWKLTLHRLPRPGSGGRLTRRGVEATLYHELVSGRAHELVVRGWIRG